MNKITEPLMEWYQKQKRDLPWRDKHNPYYTWISEIMLQQTRVEAVKPYFQRFVSALPGIEQLAECPEEQLLKLWEGLGYYNRVRNMQKAAKEVVKVYQGELPADYEKLKQLSGIGNYTAGAIASIGYGIAVPAVDGNVLRVWSRLNESSEDIMKQSVRKHVEADFQKIIPKENPGDFNQALMELGAVVCVPNGAAKCDLCPLTKFCGAFKQQTQMNYPVKKTKKERRIEERTILVIQDGERVAISRRPNKGLLAGLFELPNIEGHLDSDEVLKYMQRYDLEPIRVQSLEASKHIFSHIEWRMIGYRIRVSSLEKMREQNIIFASQENIEEKYPIPAAFAAYTRYMNIRLGQEKYQVQKEAWENSER